MRPGMSTEALRLGETFDLDGAAAEAYGAAARPDARRGGERWPSTFAVSIAARAADAQFGSAASLQPVRQAIGALEPDAAADPVARIMQAVLRAALPAAQHERAEMALLIDEMLRRESLQLEARLPAVPVLSAHEAAGYFWLQLHIYDEADRAFELAAQTDRRDAARPAWCGAVRGRPATRRAVACVRYTAAHLVVGQPPRVAAGNDGGSRPTSSSRSARRPSRPGARR